MKFSIMTSPRLVFWSICMFIVGFNVCTRRRIWASMRSNYACSTFNGRFFLSAPLGLLITNSLIYSESTPLNRASRVLAVWTCPLTAIAEYITVRATSSTVTPITKACEAVYNTPVSFNCYSAINVYWWTILECTLIGSVIVDKFIFLDV